MDNRIENVLNIGLPVMVVPGIGGHSGDSLAYLFNQDKDFIIFLIFNGFDDGSDTGKLTKAMKTPPMGDFRNTWGHMLKKSGDPAKELLGNLLNGRVENFDELRQKLGQLVNLFLKISPNAKWIKEINFDQFIREFEENYQFLPIDYRLNEDGEFINHCIGNVFLGALFQHFGTFNEMAYIIKESGLLPKNVYCASMSNEFVELVGIDIEGTLVRREKNIDNWKQPIPLNQLHCEKPGTDEVFMEKDDSIADIIRNATLLVLPATSPNNWAVITDLYQNEINQAINRANKPAALDCWTTATQETNSLGIADVILFLTQRFGDKINFIVPEMPNEIARQHPIEYSQMMLEYEEKEGKIMQFFNIYEILKRIQFLRKNFYKDLEFDDNKLRALLGRIHPAQCLDMIYIPEGKLPIDLPLTKLYARAHALLTGLNRGLKHSGPFLSLFYTRKLQENRETTRELLDSIADEVEESVREVNGDFEQMLRDLGADISFH